jgi:hypothetical protein
MALNQDYSSEGQGGPYTVRIPLSEQLSQSRSAIFDPFESSIYAIIQPDIDDWKMGSGFDGAFVVTVMSGAYEWTIGKGFLPVSTARPITLIESEEIPLLFRRWIAQAIARALLLQDQLRYPIPLHLLEEVIPKSQWTPDAKKAIAGLNHELQEGLINLETTVPGYGGPDEWYV